MKISRGFTLIELMIVVAIIAILAAIAISQYQDYVIRSQVSESSSLTDGTRTAVGEFANTYGRFPRATGNGANLSLGLAFPASIVGSYVSSVGTTGGVVRAHFASSGAFKANTAISGSELLFSPITQAGSVIWKCRRGTNAPVLRDKWLPSSCR